SRIVAASAARHQMPCRPFCFPGLSGSASPIAPPSLPGHARPRYHGSPEARVPRAAHGNGQTYPTVIVADDQVGAAAPPLLPADVELIIQYLEHLIVGHAMRGELLKVLIVDEKAVDHLACHGFLLA